MLLAACGRTSDGGRAVDGGLDPDAAPVASDGALAGDGATSGDAPAACTPGAACTPADPCHTGVIACEGGAPSCVADAPVPDGTACGAGSSCDAGSCTPGAPVALTGTCTYVDQPGWLSCPTGMACRCYYDYDKLFADQPAQLATWISGAALDVRGGTIPANDTLSGVTPATIPLTGSPERTGGVYPYTVTVSAAGAVAVTIYASSGYLPARDVLYSDADCGNRGQVLQCTFEP